MYPTVADVMSTDLITATRSTPYKQLIAKMRDRGVHALPVVETGGQLVGIVTETDLAPSAEAADAARMMQLSSLRSIPVTAERRVVGIVTRWDLLRVLARSDEVIGRDLEMLLAEESQADRSASRLRMGW